MSKTITQLKQQKVIDNMIVNDCSTKQAMIKAGYSPTYAHNSHKLTSQASFKALQKETVSKLELQRQKALARMDETIKTAKYSDATNAVDKLSKTIQLLTGGATQNININVRKMSDQELLQALQ